MDINLVNGYNKIYKKIQNKNKLKKITIGKDKKFQKLNNEKTNNEICLDNTKYLIGRILKNIKYKNYTIILIINMLILFLHIFLSREENYVSEITITIEGYGNQTILSDTKVCGGKSINVDYNPDQILINGEPQDYKEKVVYNLNNFMSIFCAKKHARKKRVFLGYFLSSNQLTRLRFSASSSILCLGIALNVYP